MELVIKLCKAINSTISVRSRAGSPLFRSNLNSLLLPSNLVTWDSRESVRKDGWSIFQGRLHGRLCYRIVSSLVYHVRRTRTDVLSSATFRYYSWPVS